MSESSYPHIDIPPSYGVVICTHHQYCILPESVFSHFSSKHTDHTTIQERQDMQLHVNSLRQLLHQDYSEVQLPATPCPVLQNLRVYRQSLRCNSCGHIHAGTTAVENMKAHLRTHGISAQGQKQKAEWWSSYWRVILSQQFFIRANSKDQQATSHFEVYYPEASETQHTADAESPLLPSLGSPTADNTVDPRLTTIDLLQAQFEEAELKAIEEVEALEAVVPLAGDRQTNPYLEHTQFLTCIQGMSWQEVREYTVPTGHLELKYLEDTIRSMTLVYQHTVALTSRWARIRIMQENWQHIPVTPLFHYQAYDLRHSNTIIKIFTFFYQIFVKGLRHPPTLCVNRAQQHAWSAIQEHLLNCKSEFPIVLSKHSRTNLMPFEELCHQFWLSLIEQTAIASDFELALVTTLAFIAVDVQQNQFRAAYNFATDLSAVKKVARFAGCQRLWDKIAPQDKLPTKQDDATLNPELETETATEPHEAAELIHEQDVAKEMHKAEENYHRAANDDFKYWIYQYLTTEYSTPMGWVITTAHYISRFRYGETLDAFVRWNGPTVTVRHISTTFEKYVGMVWALYHRAESLLSELTFTTKLGELLDIPWDNIQCDPSNTATGYTPFSPKQRSLLHGRNFVRERMLKAILEKRYKGKVIDNLQDYKQVKRYSDVVQEYLDILFLLIHFTSGQPGRLTEVASIQVENSINNGIRNVFLFEGHVAIVPRYHKGYNRDKSLKMIYRFLPRQIGSLLVWYLWLVRPFYNLLNQKQDARLQTPHYHRASSPFLWSDANGEQRKTSTGFAELMKRMTKQFLGEIIIPSIMRHLLIAFGRKLDQHDSSQLQLLTPEEVDETTNEIQAEARETQAGHMPNTAKAVYALETASVFRTHFTAPEAHLKVSLKWHQDLGFDPIRDTQETTERRNIACSLLADRISKRGNINIQRILQEHYGKTAKFKGKQLSVIENILDGEPAVSYIAATGSGKSLSFFLPACCADYGQVIIITPLVALRADIADKCKQLSLLPSRFGDEGFDETARVILAMPENLHDKRFTTMIDRRQYLGQLERIVVDEFHYVLLPDHEYRPLLLKIRDIAQYATPITLLSATVPFKQEHEAYRLLGLEGRVLAFREPTSRANIRYEVVTLIQKKDVTVQDIASYIQEQHTTSTKILVYVAFAQTVQELSEILDCHGYHGKMPEQDRSRVQRAFIESKNDILIATTAFNAGVDVPDIRMVLRFGEPDHPITWSQESGRGGRDGLPCIARIVLGKGIKSFIHKLDPVARAVLERIMQRDRENQGCIRIPIDEYFDGQTKRTCCKQDEQPCMPCQRRPYSRQPVDPNLPQTPHTRLSRAEPQTPQTKNVYVDFDNATPCETTDTPLQAHSVDRYILSSPPGMPAGLRTQAKIQNDHALRMQRNTETTGSPLSSRKNVPFLSRMAMNTDLPASPQKRHRHQVSIDSNSANVTSESSRGDIKAARIDRSLEYNREAWLSREKEGARVLQDQLKKTGEWWTNNCVRCFVDKSSFDHPKQSCIMYTGQIVQAYRSQRMNNDLGKPQCFTCFMPLPLCAKWYDEDSGILRTSRLDVPCTYPRVVLDTWACMWEYCPKAKGVWLERIKDESSGKLNGDNPMHFKTYFKEMIHLGVEKPVGRIALDVNWLTQRYFLEGTNLWEGLL